MPHHTPRLAALVGVLACSSVTAQDCLYLSPRHQVPAGLHSHDMVYDSARGVMVRFGGSTETYVDPWFVADPGIVGETWEYSPPTWVKRSSSGPSPRINHAMAYDSQRGVTVLFGGRYREPTFNSEWQYFSDTWEWNGVSWSLRSTAGPAPMAGAAMTYDSVRQRVLLVGGGTWEWNGSTWTQRLVATPQVDGHVLAFDTARSVGVLVGVSSNIVGTWEWNGNTWTQRAIGAPEYRACAVAYDPASNLTLLAGGGNGETLDELWGWDGGQWLLLKEGGIPGRNGHAMAFDTSRGVAVVFGGIYGDAIGDTWEWDGAQWSATPESGPQWRSLHALAYDAARGVTVLYGGHSMPNGQPISDTWEWDGLRWTFRDDSPWTSGSVASGSAGNPLAYDSLRAVTVLYNGWGGMAEWNGTTWSVPAPEVRPPAPRFWPGMAYDSARGVTVLFGGTSYSDDWGDTWEWDGSSWVERVVPGPPARSQHLMAYDSVRGVTVLHGGYSGGALTDTWEWDGNTWVGPLATGPSAYQYWVHASMTFDAGRGVIVLAAYSALYDWDGSTWTQRGSGLAGGLPGVAYDSARVVLLYVNGSGGTFESSQYPCAAANMDAPAAETYAPCSCYATKNRYLSFVPPAPATDCDIPVALRVTLGPMPGPSDCPKVPDYSAFNGTVYYVGPEILSGSTPTGVRALQTSPYYNDWSALPGGVVQVSDCKIVPCATYSISAITPTPSAVYTAHLVLTTTPVWADVVGQGGMPADDVVDALDVVALVQRLKDLPGAAPRTWCDVHANQPKQGVNLNIDALDISVVVSAFKGANYPFPGPATTCAP